MAADKWFEQSDENKDGTLSIKEFAYRTTRQSFENIFKRARR